MEQPNSETRLTPQEQEPKERPMRKKLASGEIERGPGRVPDDLWGMPRPRVTGGSLPEALPGDRDEAR